MPSNVCAGYFAVKRFDRRKTDGHIERQHMLTAAAILEVDWRTAAMDYHTLMKLTKILSLDNREDLEQMYRRMCFNVFAHNRDDHAKNFSWIYDEQMDCWHPSPAYDLTWSTKMCIRDSSKPVRDAATHHLALPMRGGAESLNAAVAAGIMIYEMAREQA